MRVLSPSLTPSLIALNIASSLSEAWTLASVRSLISSFLAMVVSPLPSGPWHFLQFLSQFSFTSAAEADTTMAAQAATVISIALFIIYFLDGLFVRRILPE